MPRVLFLQDFDWSPRPGVTIAFKAGMGLLVTTPCAGAAVRAGKAERVKRDDIRRPSISLITNIEKEQAE